MKVATEQLAQRLGNELSADIVSADKPRLAAFPIDGVTAKLICAPSTVEQLAAAVKICADTQATMAPWGGGTAMGLGNPPRSLDVVLKTGHLDQVIEHDHANLTATVQSGITLNALQAVLARQKQFLPIDAPLPERSTIGGVVAANLNGPRRSSYGSVRDLVIGMKVVLASGETIKAGGKVVKNVAGYDMCKLFTGALGTLGIIAEVTLRVAPLPAHSATVIATGTLAQVAQCADQLTRTKLLPSAVFLCRLGTDHSWQLAVNFDGFTETVARQVHELRALARPLGLAEEIIEGEKQPRYWQAIADLPVSQDRLLYRLTVPRGAIDRTISAISELAPTICADVATGAIWLVGPANQTTLELFPKLIALAQQQRGHAIIFNAPVEMKQAIDVWGPTTPAHKLMAKIKQEFDPAGLINPGRFIGGI